MSIRPFCLLICLGCTFACKGKSAESELPPAETAVKVADAIPAGEATCQAVANKLNELSRSEAAAMGRTWTDDKAAKKAARFVASCEEGLKSGQLTSARLQCALTAPDLPGAEKCLR